MKKTYDETTFPSHLIDPKRKDKEWILQYCKAVWTTFNKYSFGSFYDKRRKYAEIMDYAQGKQSINGYKPLMGIDEKDDTSWLNINWDVLPIFPKFRRLAMSRLKKMDFNVNATPIDPLAQSEIEEVFQDKKARLKVRQEIEKVAPGLSEMTPVAKREDDPADYEELELQRMYTYKHQMAVEMEQWINLVLEQNNYKNIRKNVKQTLFDYGIGGYKEYVDSNGAIKVRQVDPTNIVISRCNRDDFTDLQYIGEVLELSISDLKQWAGDQFSEKQYEDIANNVAGRHGKNSIRPFHSNFSRGYDDVKVRIIDLEFFSVNEMVHQTGYDKRGNKRVSRTKYGKANMTNSKYEYNRTAYKVLYKACWIEGTDYLFNYGLCTDMKRAKSKLMDTTSSYHIGAIDFYDMRVVGITEQCIPVIDELQIAWYKLQQTIAEARPKGIAIEIGALEDVALGKGGTTLSPASILDLYYQKGTLVYRKMDPAGNMTNYKPIEELTGGVGDEVIRWSQTIEFLINKLRDITGLNEFTDGSTPDSRTLTTVANMANEGTNNSLYAVVDMERNIFERLCDSLAQRIQLISKKGSAPGYRQALGKASVDFMKMNPNISMHEFGIKIEDKPTDQERERLRQQAEAMAGQDLLDFEDLMIIQSMESFKVAQLLLAYKIKRRKKEKQEESMMLQQANAQAQQQSAMVAEEEKRKTLQLEYDLKLRNLQAEIEGRLQEAGIDAESRIQVADISAEARVSEKVISAESKEYIEERKGD